MIKVFTNKKFQYISYIIIILLLILVNIYFLNQKNGLFLDEIYSYGLANSLNGPFLTDVFNGDLNGTIASNSDIQNYLTTNDNDSFNLRAILHNQRNDVHPPLFYILLNAFSFLITDTLNLWTGFVVNIIFYIFTLLFIYKSVKLVTGNRRISLIPVFLYTFSTAGISNLIYIRMYMMLTFFTCLLTYEILHYYKNKKNYVLPIIAITILLGSLTHYLYYIFAFCSSVVFIITLFVEIKNKKFRFKYLILYSLASILGVVLSFVLWPFAFEHLLSGQVTTYYDPLSIPWILSKLRNLHITLKICILDILIISIIIIVAFLYLKIKIKKPNYKRDFFARRSLKLIFFSALFTLIMFAFASKYQMVRYVFNIIPLYAMSAGIFIYLIFHNDNSIKKYFNIFVVIIVVLSLLNVFLLYRPQTYDDEYTNNQILLEHTQNNVPVLYLTNNSSTAISACLPALIDVNEFAIAKDTNTEFIKNYLSKYNSDKLVVIFDTYTTYKNRDAVRNAGHNIEYIGNYNNHEVLFEYDYGVCIELSRES